MKMDGSFVLAGPRTRVWQMLQDPEVLQAALPNAKNMILTGPDKYSAEMQVKFGPVAANFAGTVVVTDKIEPEGYTLLADAKGMLGHGKGRAMIKLKEQGPNETLMIYEGEMQVGGKLAGLGQRLIDSVARSITEQTLENLNRVMKERLSTA